MGGGLQKWYCMQLEGMFSTMGEEVRLGWDGMDCWSHEHGSRIRQDAVKTRVYGLISVRLESGGGCEMRRDEIATGVSLTGNVYPLPGVERRGLPGRRRVWYKVDCGSILFC